VLTESNLCLPSAVDTFGCDQAWPTDSGEAELERRMRLYDELPRTARWMAAHTLTFHDPSRGPCARWAVGPHLLPNLASKLVRLDFRQIPGQRGRPDTLTQLLGKGLPTRCQIRDLGPFLRKCIKKDTVCDALLLRACLCSLAGLYDHCARAAPAKLLFTLTGVFYLRPRVGRAWFAQDSSELRKLWLAILREYMVHAISTVPCLHRVVSERRDWALFRARTIRKMDAVRARFFDTGELPLVADAKTPADAKLPPNVLTGPAFHCVLLKCADRVWKRELPAMHQAGADLVALQARLLDAYRRLSGFTGFLDRLRLYGVQEPILRRLALVVRSTHGCTSTDRNTKHIEAPLRQVLMDDVWSFAAFWQETQILNTIAGAAVYSLPMHIFEMQVLALHRADTGGIPVGDMRLANAMFCTCCGRIRSSIAGGTGKKNKAGTHLNSAEVVYDPGKQQCVCSSGHSSRSTEYKSEKVFGERRPAKPSSMANLFEVTNRTQRCKSTPVAIVPMLGNMLQHNGHLYTLCCTCARLMVVTTLVTDPCVCCRGKKKVPPTCDMCKGKCSDLCTRFVWCTSFSDVVRGKSLCARCTATHAGMQEAVPNWGELLHRHAENECRRLTRPMRGTAPRRRADRSSGS